MGSRNSTGRRRQMDEDTGEENRSGSGARSNTDSDPDLATILSYLIRSGQVRILASGGMYDNDNIDDDDDDDYYEPVRQPKCDLHPDTQRMDDSEFKQQIELQSGQSKLPTARKRCHNTLSHLLMKREIGVRGDQNLSKGDICNISSIYLPNTMDYVARYSQKAFCGTYSEDGNIFLSACQDQNVRIYDTTNGNFDLFKTIRARDVGWSILDTAFSPDGNYLIYSSWSDAIHLCNIHGNHDTHTALHLCPEGARFAIFSLKFSMDNQEILGGANDGNLYVYDRERNERSLKIDAHEDDVNAVSFADSSSQILFSGGDDGLVKVWDRRMLSEENPNPIGTFAGHTDGITYIDTKGDARYLISNCKDQSIKLWDMRKFSSDDAQRATKTEVARQNWDYRWQQVPRKVYSKRKSVAGDTSLMTYRGHSVLHTLVRSRFSPMHTTGQKYIYTGCATGAVIVYDTLTGQIVKKLDGQKACVRDVSWHPFEHKIISTSWDGSVGLWSYESDAKYEDSGSESMTSSNESDNEEAMKKSKRLRCKAKSAKRRLRQRNSLIHPC